MSRALCGLSAFSSPYRPVVTASVWWLVNEAARIRQMGKVEIDVLTIVETEELERVSAEDSGFLGLDIKPKFRTLREEHNRMALRRVEEIRKPPREVST